MSWLGKLFGARSAAEWSSRADSEWNDKDYGRAKLSYESLRDAKDASAEQRGRAEARIIECRDRLASARLDEAAQLAQARDDQSVELARAEIRNALEIAASEGVLTRAREMSEALERGQARQHVVDVASEEPELLTSISAGWEPEQAEEYDRHGQALVDALIDLHEGRAAEARQALEALLAQAKDPHYLHFEVARAQLVTGDHTLGAERMRTFLSSIGPDEGGEARLAAHMELAGLAKERGDFDGAVRELEQAIEALPEDPRPYLTLGVFLRTEGHAREAIDVLQAAQTVIGEARPEWRLLQELALCHRDAGDDGRAIALLEQVVQIFSAQRLTDLPPTSAAPLAALYEQRGNKARALDLYAALAKGSDREHLFDHTLNAARLLFELDQPSDARRLQQQALELATTDAQRDAAKQLGASA